MAAVLHRQHLGQRQDAALAGGVRQPVKPARRLRADIHDRAGLLLHHHRQHGEAAPQRRIERALQLHLHLVLGVEVIGLDEDRAADIVHQHVDRGRRRRRSYRSAACAPAMVDRSASTFSASTPCSLQLGHRLRRALVDAIGDDDDAALRAETLGRRAADALPGPGDDADFVVQPLAAGRAGIEFVVMRDAQIEVCGTPSRTVRSSRFASANGTSDRQHEGRRADALVVRRKSGRRDAFLQGRGQSSAGDAAP